MIRWLGGRPDQFCSPPTARAMALVALELARQGLAEDVPVAGIACTASLASDRPKRGPHSSTWRSRLSELTAVWSIELQKDCRTRREEEALVGRMVLNAVGDACGLASRLELPHGRLKSRHWRKPSPRSRGKTSCWERPRRSTARGRRPASHGRRLSRGVQSTAHGALPHDGGGPRAARFAAGGGDFDPQRGQAAAGLRGDRTPLAAIPAGTGGVADPGGDLRGEIAAVSRGDVSVVGVDTLRRIGDVRDITAAIRNRSSRRSRRIADRGCRFLVFGRRWATRSCGWATSTCPGCC